MTVMGAMFVLPGAGPTNMTAPTANQVLAWNNTTKVWEAETLASAQLPADVVYTDTVQTISSAKTFSGGLTMSNSNFSLGGNDLKTTNYAFLEGGNSAIPPGGFGEIGTPLIQSILTNANTSFAVIPNGNAVGSAIGISRTSDIATTYEIMRWTTDTVVTGEFASQIVKGGTGSLRPWNIYMNTTKLMSFDTSNTITSYSNQLWQGKILQYNGITTAGLGAPPIYGYDKQSNLAGAATGATYTPAATGTFRVMVYVNMKSWTTPASFTATVTFTDSGGTVRTKTVSFDPEAGGTPTTAINAVGRYYGIPVIVLANAAAITVATTGTFTGTPSYDISSSIEQVGV